MMKNFNLFSKIVFSFLIVLLVSLGTGFMMAKHPSLISIIMLSGFAFLVFVATSLILSKHIINDIKIIIEDLHLASAELGDLSKELTTNSHSLAEGTNEQAASIQETSATLEESSSMVHQTAQNTKEADVLAKQSKEAADKGDMEMKNMLEAMEELKRSSGEISKIIKVIDEIAFQTNILSLNAAVEAARAGDAGKGFAVVAEEVRNLAQRSAQAAKDTSVIIESNISLSERCLNVTEQVGGSLVEIKDNTHKVSELLDEITTASQEQEIGIKQINQAIAQMENVLQSNASTAQQNAVSADQISDFSQTIVKIKQAMQNILSGSQEAEKELRSLTSTLKKEVKMADNIVKHKNAEKVLSKSEVSMQKPKAKTTVAVEKSEAKTLDTNIAKKDTKNINPEDIIPLDDF